MQAGKAQWPKNLTTQSWVKSSSATGIFQMKKKKLLHLRWENPDFILEFKKALQKYLNFLKFYLPGNLKSVLGFYEIIQHKVIG